MIYNKFKKSQVLMLSLLTILLIIAPQLSSSLRPTYIYFITNLLIIALVAEAGLLSLILANPSSNSDHNTNTNDHKKNTPNNSLFVSQKSHAIVDHQSHANNNNGTSEQQGQKANNIRVVEKCLSEKIVGSVKVEKVQKCPSMPSLFFIGGHEGDNNNNNNITNNNIGDKYYFEEYYDEEEEEDEEKEQKQLEELGEISGQELFAKAESFIGNFYKQLKMQREDSWKRIHGFYQRAF